MDLELRESVALKTISPAIASSANAIERFKLEVKESRRITHSSVCRVHDLFTHEQPDGESLWFLSMELPGRADARRFPGQWRPMPIGQAVPLIGDMVAALSAAHALGIVHRDFKPSNVMLVKEGSDRERAVVTDFGLALNLPGTRPRAVPWRRMEPRPTCRPSSRRRQRRLRSGSIRSGPGDLRNAHRQPAGVVSHLRG